MKKCNAIFKIPSSLSCHRLLKMLITLTASAAFALAPVVGAEAKTKSIKPAESNEKAQALGKAIFEGLRTKQNAMAMLGNAGVATEGLRIIEKDLSKRLPEKAVVPQLSLSKDEVLVDGKPTGIRVVTYSPLKLKFQDRTWMLSERMSTDENYFSLIKFLEYRRTASRLSLFVPQANALFDDAMSGMFQGAMIGMVGVGFLGMAFGYDPLMSMFVGTGIGAIFGGLYGKSNEVPAYQRFPAYQPGQPYPNVR